MLRVETPSGFWSALCTRVSGFLEADLIDLEVDGVRATGFRSPDSPALWIRDHSDILRGGRYQHADVQSAVDLFAAHQSASGRVFDYVTTTAGTEPENWEKWVRVPVEADVEFRFVKAAFLAWQASGDDDWIRALLPALEAALEYTCGHPWRWDATLDLPKRAYTVDTWDFDYTAGREPWLNFTVSNQTFWGVMHGDVSGLYEAMTLLADLNERFDDLDAAARWRDAATSMRDRANELLFNGRFYTHFHKITPVTIDGLDEAEQLSLSNPMDVNRGLATHEMAVSILNEYRRRRATTGAFAEWFSIDPPFPDGAFGDPKIVGGAYINGGVMPLVGGELARAAFEHGLEGYGVDILRQYGDLIAETGETYLWYFPDGRPSDVESSTSPDAMPTDGWGSSAMLYALVEGLCGVEDLGHSFRRVRCAPRWAAALEDEARVEVGYAASGASFGYGYAHDATSRTITVRFEGEADVRLHLLMPPGARPESVRWDGAPADLEVATVEDSVYANAQGDVRPGTTVEVRYGDA
ncbi:hypothetical protein [Rubrivirga sp.]|uniref:hypothetical protein n=1 Tax=Rubrivirga sp. TaxID=1885344 RepID=UPI003B51C5B5